MQHTHNNGFAWTVALIVLGLLAAGGAVGWGLYAMQQQAPQQPLAPVAEQPAATTAQPATQSTGAMTNAAIDQWRPASDLPDTYQVPSSTWYCRKGNVIFRGIFVHLNEEFTMRWHDLQFITFFELAKCIIGKNSVTDGSYSDLPFIIHWA